MSAKEKNTKDRLLDRLCQKCEEIYNKAFSEQPPEEFWKKLDAAEDELSLGIRSALQSAVKVRNACDKFLKTFQQMASRYRVKQTGKRGQKGSKVATKQPKSKAFQDPKRPEDYLLWTGSLLRPDTR